MIMGGDGSGDNNFGNTTFSMTLSPPNRFTNSAGEATCKPNT